MARVAHLDRASLVSRRPLSITLLGWLFVCFGVVSSAAAVLAMLGIVGSEGSTAARVSEFLPMFVVQALAAVGGALVLRGNGIGRWLLVAWMTYHVVLSGFHEPIQLLLHGAMLAAIVYLLVRSDASAYFRRGKPDFTAEGTEE